jgi:hypothetical protein
MAHEVTAAAAEAGSRCSPSVLASRICAGAAAAAALPPRGGRAAVEEEGEEEDRGRRKFYWVSPACLQRGVAFVRSRGNDYHHQSSSDGQD